MSGSTAWWRLVAAREVTTRMRDKTFLISTGVLLLVVAGSIVLTSLLGGRPPSYDVAVTDRAG
ncbi:MAG: ABC transporter permease, partial [Propionibacteriales bacterium]|nr:ABC transporter permease [Propionibacteriales bacterium]